MRDPENIALALDDMIHRSGRSVMDTPCTVTPETADVLKRITDITDRFTPLYEGSEKSRFWLHAPGPSLDEYKGYMREGAGPADWDDCGLTDADLSESYGWHYPDGQAEKWFEVLVIHTPKTDRYPEFIAVFLNNAYIFAVGDPNSRDYREDRTGDANLLLNLIRGVESDIRDNTYNADVARNLPYGNRTGVIARRAYYDIFPEKRSAFRKGLTDEELTSLARDAKRGEAFPDDVCAYPCMTARLYFEAAATAVSGVKYRDEDIRFTCFAETEEEKERYGGRFGGYSAREIYCHHADGRDNGLTGIPLDDADAFGEWMEEKGPYFIFNGNRPWEIRGATSVSRSIHLYPVKEDKGWYFLLTGDAYGTSYETVKYYLAMKKAGIPVVLGNIEKINARYAETDNVGILPSYEYSPWMTYIPERFTGMDVNDCIELPCEREEPGHREQVIQAARWLPEQMIGLH